MRHYCSADRAMTWHALYAYAAMAFLLVLLVVW